MVSGRCVFLKFPSLTLSERSRGACVCVSFGARPPEQTPRATPARLCPRPRTVQTPENVCRPRGRARCLLHNDTAAAPPALTAVTVPFTQMEPRGDTVHLTVRKPARKWECPSHRICGAYAQLGHKRVYNTVTLQMLQRDLRGQFLGPDVSWPSKSHPLPRAPGVSSCR